MNNRELRDELIYRIDAITYIGPCEVAMMRDGEMELRNNERKRLIELLISVEEEICYE